MCANDLYNDENCKPWRLVMNGNNLNFILLLYEMANISLCVVLCRQLEKITEHVVGYLFFCMNMNISKHFFCK